MLVSYITVVEDLAMAVLAGTILSALSFAWKQSTSIYSSQSLDEKTGWRVFKLSGPIFFGSTQTLENQFDIKKIEEEEVVIDFSESRVYDHSALEAINKIADKFGESGKKVHLRHLSPDCQLLLANIHKGGVPPYELIERDDENDPLYEPVEDSAMFVKSA